jgi:hypothetical protein
MTRHRILATICVCLFTTAALAQLPPPPEEKTMADWTFPWTGSVPGEMSAGDLIDKPAGKNGPVVSRDGHFYTGDKRIRFVGVNIAFAGNFPAHEQADALAKRFANFGINIVRFHHMDNQPFPGGIFADRGLEKLSDEALERLDYFIAALKKEGVYADLNLHVSRPWSRTKKWPDAAKLEGYDKQLDIFHPDLIAANKQYAKDLLSHVNAYTKNRYADEPAVAMVEINNEDTIFLWGGEQKLAELPETYAAMLQKQWNAWLVKEYGTKEKLKEAWAKGAEPLSKNELVQSPRESPKRWLLEQHGAAKAKTGKLVEAAFGWEVPIEVSATDGVDWHIQYTYSGIKLQKGKFYTLSFDSWTGDKPVKLSVAIGMAHEPWGNLGLSRRIELEAGRKVLQRDLRFGFVATADDDNARIAFQLGAAADNVHLQNISLREGGREGLAENEDPAKGHGMGFVQRGGLGNAETPARTADWYRFLKATDETYFIGMYDFLKKEVGVKCPITGTIGLGMLGSLNQAKMDFVDAHAYWDHPHFPRKQWDMKDWEIKNKPMVDDPAGATLWGLAATRFWHKPFTVTEYNHAAPNEWQAECVPMIFAYAATQDWDAVFLFDYTGDTKYEKQITSNFFSIEGNASKMGAMPLAARLFLSGAVAPSPGETVVQPTPTDLYENAAHYFYQQWPFLRDVEHITWQQAFGKRLAIWDVWKPLAPDQKPLDERLKWTASGAGTGRFILADPNAAVFVGFSKGEMPLEIGVAKIDKLETPFAAIQIVSAESGKSVKSANRVLISATARQSAEGMAWDAKRTSVSNQWGKSPAKIEVVKADIELHSDRAGEVWALGPDGKRRKQIQSSFVGGQICFSIGAEPTMWYEIVRK